MATLNQTSNEDNFIKNCSMEFLEYASNFFIQISEIKLFDYRILSFLATVIILINHKLALKWCRSPTCLVGKTVVVTGANTGIGFAAATDFAKRGAKVILACRNEEKANDACKKLKNLTGNKEIYVKILNLASLKSVKKFVDHLNSTEEKLDILVNNAAMPVAHPKTMTEDGFHLVKQVNHLSPFLLTVLLMDLLKRSVRSRIINVSSFMASVCQMDLEKLADPKSSYTYSESKLCNILFTKELAKLCLNTNVTVYSMEPGAVRTQIFRKLRGIVKFLVQITKFYYKTPEEGAQTIIYLGVEKNIEKFSGEHFSNCGRTREYLTVSKKNLPKRPCPETELV